MKFTFRRDTGSVVVVMLITTILVGVTLGSYLHMVSNQNLSIMRSMAWNNGIGVAEAGIEEAMAHLNANTTNRLLDDWIRSGTNVLKERVIGDYKYRVYINKDVDPPFIVSEGHVRNPKDGKFLPRPRIVRVATTNDALFAKGIVAKGQIDLSGNKVKTDSFDSSDPNYSTNGRYDPAKFKDGGDIATNSGVVDSLNVWNADIYGRASTGPGGNIKLGANGSVGSMSWHLAGNTGAEPGWTSDDMNVYFHDVKAPFSSTQANVREPFSEYRPVYQHVLSDGRYYLPELYYAGNEKMYVAGNATLLVLGEFNLMGNAQIIIATNASLKLYVAGQKTTIAGSGVLNHSGKAENFSYWGLPTNKEVKMQGNAGWVGTIYAPNAALILGGGGSDTYDFVGASVSDTVKLNGHYNFHYDEALNKFGLRRGYTIISWHENVWEEM